MDDGYDGYKDAFLEEQHKRIELEEYNIKLRRELLDMIYLILEHGSPMMKAHATRIGRALKVVNDFIERELSEL